MQNIFLATMELLKYKSVPETYLNPPPTTTISVKLNNTSKHPIGHRKKSQRILENTLNGMKMK